MFITKKEFFATSYFLSRAMFLGVGFSYIFRFSGKDAWISIILGYLLGNMFIYIFDKVSKNINYNLNYFLNKGTLITKLYKFLFFITYTYLLFYVSVIFTNFVKVYYLFDTPTLATMLLLFTVCIYGALKSENTILRISIILLPFSILINLSNSTLLTSFLDYTNFAPILTTNISNIFISALIYGILSSIPNILLLEYKVPLKTKLISYAVASGIIFLINFYVIGVLGEFLIKSYSYPEYMVLRRIRLLDFIENIENFASIIWYFDAFILITLAISKIRKMFTNKSKNILIPLLLIIMSLTAYNIFASDFVAIINFFGTGIIVFGILLIITGPVLYLITKKRKT